MFNSITTKLIVFMLIAVLPMVFGITYFSYKYSSTLLIKKTKEQAKLLLQNAEYKINMRTTPVQKIPLGIAANLPNSPTELESLMIRTLNENYDIFGMAAAFEPNTFNPGKELYSPYAYNSKGYVVLSNLDTVEYNYQNQEWYKKPKLKHESVWSEPYFDKGGGNLLMSTYSYPIYKNSGFYGVLTVDITLADLARLIKNIQVLYTGYAFLISADGMVMVHPDKELVMNKNVIDINSKEFSGIVKSIHNKNKTTFESSIETDDNIVWFKEIQSTGWYIGVVFPKKELLEPVFTLSYILLFISFLSAVLMVCVITFISRKVTGRMQSLSESASKIADGNFNTPMPLEKGKDELSKLSVSFETMRKSLIKYIENLRVTENSKQRIESELSIAKDIQQGILPKIFPPFPDRDDIDIYASMTSAREVGGDLYDFFFLDKNLLCLLIGDVSGKGVPASLFMAVSKTLIKAVAHKDISAGDVFSKVNSELANGNDNCMFVTAFIAILDVSSGEMTYANAGHNPPMIISDSSVSLIEYKAKPPLGAFDAITYETYQMKLKRNDTLFLYTDGVTEAMNIKNEQYSEARLLNTLSNVYSKPPQEIVETIYNSIAGHVRDAKQHDDITMLCICSK